MRQTYMVWLTGKPSDNVRIALSEPNDQLTLEPTMLTFTPNNWDTAQTISVRAKHDGVKEGQHRTIIMHDVTSSDSGYDGFTMDEVSVTIQENLTYKVQISQTSVEVSEEGDTASYTVKLTNAPAADVVVTLQTDDDQITLSATTLTFTPNNWDSEQTITVKAIDDLLDEADTHTVDIAHMATSNDSDYNNTMGDAVAVTITDNDTADVKITPLLLKAQEGVGSTTYKIVLTSKPSDDVSVRITTDAELTTNPTLLSFTPDTWDEPQTVIVKAVDEGKEEGIHQSKITHRVASKDDNYAGLSADSVSVRISEVIDKRVIVKPTSLNIAEGGDTINYTVSLTGKPAQDVTVTISNTGTISPSHAVSPTNDLDLISRTVTFTPDRWDVSQIITITALDDDVIEGTEVVNIAHSVSSDDEGYDNAPTDGVVVTIADNDSAGVDLDRSLVKAEEGGPIDGYYRVRLTTIPQDDVTITFGTDSRQVQPISALTFTPDVWDTWQPVTVKAITDTVKETTPHTSTITHRATSSDNDYNGLAIGEVTVAITDTNTAEVVVEPQSLTISEPIDSEQVIIRLTSEPSSTVTIDLTSTDTSECNISPSVRTVTLDADNWQDGVTVAVNAVDDDVADGDQTCTIETSVSKSDDPNYTLLSKIDIDNVVVTVKDDDTVGIMVEPQSLTISEPKGTATFTIKLNSQPTDAVVINLASQDTTACTITDAVTITAATWKTGVPVPVTAVDDDIADGDQTCPIKTLESQSSDSAYDGFVDSKIDDVTVTVVDDDSPGGDDDAKDVTITPKTLSIKEGETESYTIVLDKKPSSPVIIYITPDTQVKVNDSTDTINLRFTPGNWDEPQTVTVEAIYDKVNESSPHPATIKHVVIGGDYTGVSKVKVDITDKP